MGLPNKEEIKEKLLDFPLLRQLVCERWFRIAFIGFLSIFIFLALFLPKIWRASRPGFRPVIRVSGLDLVQAWSLRRTALKATAAGRFEEANYAWQAALANNRADPELVRGALRSFLQDPNLKQHTVPAIPESYWLLKLTETNSVPDMELAAHLFERFKYYDPIIELVENRTKGITPPLAASFLKALFWSGRLNDFEARWNEVGSLAEKDPEIPLYHAAYLVGWGPPETITDARKRLSAASGDPTHRILASQLNCVLAAKALNPDSYAQALRQLEDWHEDTLSNHARYWRLLIETGRKEEAIRLLQAYPHGPSSPMELVELDDVYARLNMRDQGVQLLKRYQDQFGNTPIFWVTYANELAESKRWEDLRNFALQIRGQDAMRDVLGGFSYFLEGRSELALGRAALAHTAFQNAADRDFPYYTLGMRVGGQLLQLGEPALARQVLVRLEKPLEKQFNYWVLLFSVADRLKDVDLLVKAADRAFHIAPRDPVAINNYAAALLINREKPDEAIKLTLELVTENPNSLYAVVNHSAALLLNDRPREAEVLLERIRTNGLTRAQLALYNLDLFETYCGLQKFKQAWSTSDQIETDFLYPTQQKWLEQKRKQLPPRSKASKQG
jgi:predicted Zn-dependent protease